jgi:hypothetical protein
VRRPWLAASLTAGALATAASGCGGDGEDLVEEGSLRECLATGGLKFEPVEVSGGAVLGSASPDFRLVTEEGDGVDVVVEKDEQRAERTAADIRGSLATFGSADSVILVNRNAVVVFEAEPPGDLRQSVEDCLEGG